MPFNVFPIGHHVALENIHFGPGVLLFDEHRVFQGGGAAEASAVGSLGDPGPDAVDHDHVLRKFDPLLQHLLQFQRSDHIGQHGVAVIAVGLELLSARSHDDRPHLELDSLLLIRHPNLEMADEPFDALHRAVQVGRDAGMVLHLLDQRSQKLAGVLVGGEHFVHTS